MEKYEEVALEVIQFEREDIIVTSGESEFPPTPICPSDTVLCTLNQP